MLTNHIYKKIGFILLVGVGILSYGGFCEDKSSQTDTGSSVAPQAPSNLIATAVLAVQVDLTWTDNSNNEDGFRIERKIGTNGIYQPLVTLPANTTVFSDTTVSEITGYSYRLIAYNAIGDSAFSNEANITTPWTIIALDTQGNIGGHAAMAFDSDNKVHISYYDYSNSALKYITNASGSWAITTVDNTGEVGEFSSIAVDKSNKVHISYYDRTNAHLKYAANLSGDWQTSTIDPNGHNGFYSSIGLDSDNKVHISYYDNYTSDLKYATNTSGSWQTSLIDSAGYVGLFSSLVVDQSNKVHISYYDQTNGDLKYATNNSGQWVVSTIDSTGNVGFYTDIAMDSNNKIHISYGDWGNRDLKYATNKNGSWQVSTIDTVGDVGDFTAIAVDSKNNVHISYYDATNKALKYIAQQDAGGWLSATVDRNNCGEYNSICLGPNQVHIAYLDMGNWNLKYATNSQGNWQVIPSPSGLAASAVSPYQIDLVWTDNSNNEDGFKVERRAEDENDYIEVATVISNTTSYSDTGLIVFTIYSYRIKAYSASDNSLPSNESSAQTFYAQSGIAALAAPADGAIEIPTSPVLSWEPATNTTSYLLQVAPTNDFTLPVVNTEITGTSYAVSGLNNLTNYYWRVKAKNRGGTADWSTVFSFMTIIAAPDQPLLANPANDAVDITTSPVLQWNPANRATSYRLQFSDTADFSTTIVDQTNITATTYSLSSLAYSSIYYWRVNATNIGGTSNWSAASGFTTVIAPPSSTPVLATPANSATWLSTSPVFSWEAVTVASSYRIQVSTSSDFSSIVIDQPNIVVTSYQGATLATDVTYYWRASASNIGGAGPWSGAWSFTTIVAPPLQPVLASPSNNSVNIPINPTLIWNITNGATSYRFQLSTDSNFGTTLVDQSNITGTSLPVSGLTNLTIYYWRVQASNIAGISAWSASGGFTTIIATPTQPVLVSPADNIAGMPLNQTLSWNTADRAESYSVQVAADTAFTNLVINQTGINGTSYQLSGLSNNATYYWRLKAVNAGGESNWTSYRSFTTVVATPVLSSPADNATLIPVNTTAVWNPVSGAVSYQLQLATDTGFANIVIDQSGIAVTSAPCSGLINYTDYYWRVRASNAGGMGNWSNIFKFTTIVAMPDPPVLTGPANGATGVAINPTLQWNSGARASAYRLQVSLVPDFVTTVRDQNNVGVTSYQVSGLVNNNLYYWRVCSINAAGSSAWSGIFSFTTIVAAPSAPSLLSPNHGAVDIIINPTLIWNASSNATSYGLQVSTAENFATTVVNQTNITFTSFQIAQALNHLTIYYWRVNAANTGGTSGWSSTWSFTTAPLPPAQPTLASPADGAIGIWLPPSLQWNAAGGATSYTINIATDSNFTSPLTFTSTSTTCQPAGLANSTTYWWRVRAVNNGGESDWTPGRSFTSAIPTPTLSWPANNAINIVTNPTLQWNAVGSATAYRIHIATDAAFNTIIVNQTTGSGTTSYAASLNSGITYWWRVYASKDGVPSDWSTVWDFTTTPPLPAQPQLLSPVDTADRISTSPTLRWNPADYASSYKLELATDVGFSSIVFSQTAIAGTSKVITGLNNDTNYFWHVKSSNITGDSAWSSTWSFTTMPVVPDQPTLVSPTNGVTGLTTSVICEWNAVTNTAVTYRLRVASDPFFTEVIVDQANIAVTSYDISGLINYATEYYYQVKAKAVADAEESDWSAGWNFTTLISMPTLTSPQNGLTNFPSVSPVLSWNPVPGATLYRVQVATDTGFTNIILDQPDISELTYQVSPLNYLSTYYWRVQASSPDVTSVWSLYWSFTTIIALSNAGSGSWKYYKPITITNSTSAISNCPVAISPFIDVNPVNNSGLVASFHFNEPAGTVLGPVYDTSGYANSATLNGFVSPDGIVGSGKFGNGVSFDGNNDYISVVDSTALRIGYNFSVEAWVNLTSIAAERAILCKSNEYLLRHYPGDGFSFFLWDGVDWEPGIRTGVNAETNAWYHVVGTWDGTTQRLYVNGILVNSATHSFIAYPTTNQLEIGRWSGSNYMNGFIDEVKIYKRTLLLPEIQARYNAGSNIGSNKVNTDCTDIRFTNSAMTQEFSYWRESDNKFWVKIPDLQVGNTAIRMFYGNSSATSVSNGNNTFMFFDDFSGGSLDINKWQASGTYQTVDGGRLNITGGTGSWNNGMYSKQTFARDNWLAEADFRTYAGSNSMWGVNQSSPPDYNYDKYPYNFYPNTTNLNTREYSSGLASNIPLFTPAVWYKLRIMVKAGGGALYYISTDGGNTYQLCRDSTTDTTTPLRIGYAGYNRSFYLDNWLVRKYLSSEPTVLMGTETQMGYVTNLVAAVVSDTQINLAWQDNSDNEDGFKVERSPDGITNWTQIATATANSTTYPNSGLTPDTDYYYRVRSYNATIGDAPYSDVVLSRTSVPTAPSGLITTTVAASIGLQWTDNSNNEDGFKIERKTDAGGTYAVCATLAANTTSWTDGDISLFNTYYYQVMSYNTVGNSSYSNEVFGTTKPSNHGNGNWAYHRPITITNIGSALSDYQVAVTTFTDPGLIDNTGLIASWHFSEALSDISNITLDTAGRGYNGILNNSPSRVNGRFGNALSFNGSNGYMDVANFPNYENFTAELWLNLNANLTSAVRNGIIGNWGAVNYRWMLWHETTDPDNTVRANLYRGSTIYSVVSSPLSLGTWYHVVIKVEPDTLGLIINNGTPITTTTNGTMNYTTNYTLPIGRVDIDGTYRYVNAKIDEVRIYNRVLSAAEIANHYNGNLPKVRHDYGDIRFTNSDMTQEIPCWQESDGRFWIKMPSLPNGNTLIKMFYGNPSATTSSDGSNIFVFFDNFDDGIIDTAKWYEYDTSNYITESAGLLRASNWTGVWTNCLMYTMAEFNRENLELHFDYIAKSGGNGRFMWGWKDTDNTPEQSYKALVYGMYDSVAQSDDIYEDTVNRGSCWNWSDIGYKVRLQMKSGGGALYQRSTDGGYTWETGYNSTYSTETPVKVGLFNLDAVWDINNLFVRKYSASEPICSIGAETQVNVTTGLSAIVAAGDQVNLAWQDNSLGEDGFKIERSFNGSDWIQINTAAPNATGYSDSTVTATNTYYYRVRSYDIAGDHTYSSVVTTTTSAPTAPASLVTSTVTANTITLEWQDNSNNETGFKLERSIDGNSWTVTATIPADATSYTDTVLTMQRTYYYRIFAYNGSGDSSYSNVISSTMLTLANAGGGNWQYFRPITITNSGSALTDYQVAITPFTDSNFINNTGLVGSWHFSEPLTETATSTTDLSGNSNNGTLVNSPTRTAGRFGNGLSFNGTNNYVTVSSYPNYDTFTAELWVYLNTDMTTGTCRGIIGNWETSNYRWLLWQDSTDSTNAIKASIYRNSTTYNTVTATLTTDQWYYVVIKAEPNMLSLIIDNGTPLTVTTTGVMTYTSGHTLYMGGVSISGAMQYVDAKIDEVRTYDRALSAAEIAARYNSGSPKVAHDYSDIRFTNSNATAELPFWQETDSRFWVRVPSLPGGDTGLTMFYGNVSATDASNGPNTFIFFDAFDGSAIDAGRWPTSDGSISVSGGIATFNIGSYAAGINADLRNGAQGAAGLIIESRAKAGATNLIGSLGAVSSNYFGMSNMAFSAEGFNHLWWSNNYWYAESAGTSSGTESQRTTFDTNWRNITMTWLTGTSVYFNSYATYTKTDFIPSAMDLTPFYPYIGSNANTTLQMDYIRVRKYAAAEPTILAVGAEDQINVTTRLSAVVATDSQVNLAWQDNSVGEQGFKIERSFNGTDWTQIDTTVADTAVYFDTTVTATNTYYYRVRSYNLDGDHAYSDVISTTTSAPAAPANLITTTVTANTIILQWQDNSNNETGFKMERSIDGSNWTITTTIQANATSWTDTGLNIQGTYYYRIFAYNAVGDSTYSNVISATTIFSYAAGGNWLYYRPITITNSGSALTDYQVAITPFADTNFIDNTGLVGSWHFSETLTDTATATADMSGNSNSGTLYNSPTRVVGRFGNALSFDGSSNYVNIADSATLDITDQISIEAWISPTNVTGNKMLVGKRSAWAVNGCPYDLMQIDNAIHFYIYGTSLQSAQTAGGTISANNWQYIVATYDGINMKVYIDGVEKATTPTNIAIPTNNAFVGIGRRSDGAFDYFTGRIDEVRIYSRALSASEIAARHNSGTPKVQYDYADIRFGNPDMTSELPYWQETDNKFWVKVPSLTTGDTTIKMFYGNVSATDSSNIAATMINDTTTGFKAPVPKGTLSNDDRTWSAGSVYSSVVLNKTFDSQFFEMVTYWAHNYRGYGMVYGPGVNHSDWTGWSNDGSGPYWGALNTSGFPSGYSGTFFGQYHAPIDGGGAATTGYYFRQKKSGNTLTLQYSTDSSTGPWTNFTTNYTRNTSDSTDKVAIGMGEASSTEVTPLSIQSLYYSKYASSEPTVSAVGSENSVNVASNLAAVVASDTQVNLSWQDNSFGELGFKIERSFNGTDWTQIDTISDDVTAYSDTTVTATNTYYYRIRSYDVFGDHAYSNVITTTTAAPLAPSGLVTTAIGGTYISLQWTDNANNETGFKIERSINGSAWSEIATVNANVTSWTDRPLRLNSTYYYRVRAYNVIGNSNYSNIIYPTTALPLAHWQFDETSGMTAADTSLNGYNGTVSTATWTAGISNNALNFNGTDAFVTIPNSISFGLTSKLTIAMWVKGISNTRTDILQPLLSKWGYNTTFDINNFTAYDAGSTSGLTTKGFEGAVFDGRYMYFVPHYTDGAYHGRVLRYDTTGTFTTSASWTAYDASATSSLNCKGYYGGVFDGRYIYFTPHYDGGAYHGRALRYDTTGSFTDSSSWVAYDAGSTSGLDTKGYYGSVFDGRYVYFVPALSSGTYHGRVLRLDTTGSFTDSASWLAYDAGSTSGLSTKGYLGASFDGRYIYFAPHYESGVYHGRALRYDTTGGFTNPVSWTAYDAGNTLGIDTKGYYGCVFDGRYVYYVPALYSGTYHGRVLRYDTTGSFTAGSSWTAYDAGFTSGLVTKGYYGAVFDGKYVYFVPHYESGAYHSRVLRLDTTGVFGDSVSWSAIDAGSVSGLNTKSFYGAGFDGRYIYFAPSLDGSVYHGRVLRYDTAGSNASYSLRYSDMGNQGNSGAVPGIRFILNTANGPFSVAANTNHDTNWHHLAAVYDGSYLKLYVDGAMLKQTPASGDVVSNSTALMFGTNGYKFYKGLIDNTLILKEALADEDITNLYNNPLIKTPSNLVASVVTTSRIDLTWQDNSNDELGFKIERSEDALNWSTIDTTAANITIYANSGLTPDTTYYYRVRSYNGSGDDTYSTNIASSRTSAPSAPSDLITTTVTTSTIGLQWADNSINESGFKLERKTIPTDTNFALIATLPPNTTSYTNSGLALGTIYNYRVYAYNGINVSAYSNTLSATTLAVVPICMVFYNTSTGQNGTIQTFTITTTGTYRIEAWGAQGGNFGNNTGGFGARMCGDFSLTAGQQLKILVGQQGTGSGGSSSTGGGGGSFVTLSDNTPLIIAGGGGGGGNDGVGKPGNTTTSGTDGGTSNARDGKGGTNGGGGGGAVSGSGAGGGGLLGRGGDCRTGTYDGNGGAGGSGTDGGDGTGTGTLWTGSGGLSFLSGGTGGSGNYNGGFGGGGAGRNWNYGGGGGGGYSGGGGGSYDGSQHRHGGGGGSYNVGTNQSNSSGVNPGHGLVIIRNVATINQTFYNTSIGQNGTIQNWTVPATGVYRIETWGAQGGNNNSGGRLGGLGARMRGDFTLTAGTQLKILVGQQGIGNNYEAGGGGGTFVTDSSNNPLIIAGGGGGASNSSNGIAGSTGTSGTVGAGSGGGTPGSNGSGGSGSYGASGGGITGNGGNATWGGPPPGPGLGFINGGTGGSGNTSPIVGGYGGGAGAHGNSYVAGGGGGGYSGGTGGLQSGYGGGGGGSYNSGTNQTNSSGVKSGQGLVTIQSIW